MAFAWNFFHELDKENVDKLYQCVQNIKENFEKLDEIKGANLSDAETEALEMIVKKHKKSLDHSIEVLSAFDQELDAFAKGVFERAEK